MSESTEQTFMLTNKARQNFIQVARNEKNNPLLIEKVQHIIPPTKVMKFTAISKSRFAQYTNKQKMIVVSYLQSQDIIKKFLNHTHFGAVSDFMKIFKYYGIKYDTNLYQFIARLYSDAYNRALDKFIIDMEESTQDICTSLRAIYTLKTNYFLVFFLGASLVVAFCLSHDKPFYTSDFLRERYLVVQKSYKLMYKTISMINEHVCMFQQEQANPMLFAFRQNYQLYSSCIPVPGFEEIAIPPNYTEENKTELPITTAPENPMVNEDVNTDASEKQSSSTMIYINTENMNIIINDQENDQENDQNNQENDQETNQENDQNDKDKFW